MTAWRRDHVPASNASGQVAPKLRMPADFYAASQARAQELGRDWTEHVRLLIAADLERGDTDD